MGRGPGQHCGTGTAQHPPQGHLPPWGRILPQLDRVWDSCYCRDGQSASLTKWRAELEMERGSGGHREQEGRRDG